MVAKEQKTGVAFFVTVVTVVVHNQPTSLHMSIGPGARLGAYEIVGLLGAGGMGQVYRARDTKLGRDVAKSTVSKSRPKPPHW